MADGRQGGESIALAGGIALGLEEGLEKLGGIGHEGFVVLVDGGNGEDGILSNIGMAVFKTSSCRSQKRLNQFGIAQLAQKSQSVASDVFVRVLQIHSDTIAKCHDQ